jgi:alpha-mannosidase
MNRFDCRVEFLPEKPAPSPDEKEVHIHFDNDELTVEINKETGLIDVFKVDGDDFLTAGACKPIIISHNPDPWGMRYTEFRDVVGSFSLLSPEKSAEISGINASSIAPVRVIEDGDVRTVVEATFGYMPEMPPNVFPMLTGKLWSLMKHPWLFPSFPPGRGSLPVCCCN